MTTLLEIREKIKMFFEKYEVYVKPVFKFLLALLVFFAINSNIGFMTTLSNPLVSVVLGLICALLPVNMIAIFAGILIVAHAYVLSLEVCAIVSSILVIMGLLYFRLAPKHGYLLILTPIMFVLKIPYALPLVMGLFATPVAAIPIGFGTVVYYIMKYMKMNTQTSTTEVESMQQKVIYLIDNLLRNQEMVLIIIAFTLTILVVYGIRKLSIDYAGSIAVGVGFILEIFVLLVGSLALNVKLGLIGLILGGIISALIAISIQLFVLSVDYSRTEYTQFEDDDYYYYVKAVPKVSIAVSNKQVKKISTRRNQEKIKRERNKK